MRMLFLMLFYGVSYPVYPQDTVVVQDTLNRWIKGGSGLISFSQVSFSNWAAGGINTMSLNSSLNLSANYYTLHNSWENSLDVDFGLNKQNDLPIVKSDDRLELSSKYGWQWDTSSNWSLAALLNFRTQFRPGYQDLSDTLRMKISDFLSPAYLTFAPGLDYKPIKDLSVFISPITLKMTYVSDDSLSENGAYGVQPGEKFRAEIGASFRLEYKKSFGQHTELMTRLDLFSNYANNPENIDVNWETSLLVKLNKYIAITFGTLLIYDDDVDVPLDLDDDGVKESFGPRTQFRQMFGAGLSFKF